MGNPSESGGNDDTGNTEDATESGSREVGAHGARNSGPVPAAAATSTPPGGTSQANAGLLAAVGFAEQVGRVFEQQGPAAGVMFVTLGAVWVFGSAETKDQFIRDVLWAEKGPWLRGFFLGVLVLLLVSIYYGRRRREAAEGNELRRVSDEKSALQQNLIGAPLHHGASAATTPSPNGNGHRSGSKNNHQGARRKT